MKQERLNSLDFIRVIAMAAILITHYNAYYLFGGGALLRDIVITASIGNLYIGDWGVSLFFFLSGASLMYVYENKLDLKLFYKKRFLSIYPMFWLAYLAGFLYRIITGYNWQGIPKYRILYSILGADGLLISNGVRDFYVLGEWFLGFIILFYLVFPILRTAVNKNDILTFIGVVCLALLTVKICGLLPWSLVRSTVLFVRLPELVFGMLLVKRKIRPNLVSGLLGLVLVLANAVLKPPILKDIQVFYVGLASFFFLSYLASLIKNEKVMLLFQKVGKYSYAVFLVHHLITDIFFTKVSVQTMTRTHSYVSFLGLCVIIGFCAWMLYRVNSTLLGLLKGQKLSG